MKRCIDAERDKQKKDAAAAATGKPKQTAGELRLQKDLTELTLPSNISISFPDGKEKPMHFEIVIKPDEGSYRGGKFIFDFVVLTGYPYDAPKVKCKTKVYHPNIDLEGNICLNILREDWKPVLSISSVVFGLQFLFLDPNPEDPLNKEAATKFQENPRQFESYVQRSIHYGAQIDNQYFPPYSRSESRHVDGIKERNEEGVLDITEQNRTFEDAVFASLHILSKNRNGTDLRWTTARVVLEFLQMFLVIFNTEFQWKIDTHLWIWKASPSLKLVTRLPVANAAESVFAAISWILFRNVVVPEGYDTYITLLYVLDVLILLSIAATVWVALALRKDETGSVWMRRLQVVLQYVGLVFYSMFWVGVLDYIIFAFNCDWAMAGKGLAYHEVFTDNNCLALPHLAHMLFSFVTLVLFCFAAIGMSLCDSDLNPLTRNQLATSLAVTGMKSVVARIAIVGLSTCLNELGKAQSVLMLICVFLVTYFLFKSVPYYYDLVNFVFVGLWAALVYTCVMLVALEYTLDSFGTEVEKTPHRERMTMGVLYGVFPVVILGAVCSFQYVRFCRRPLKTLQAAFEEDSSIILKDVYKFKDAYQAEFLMRVMRKWDEDGVPDAASGQFGEFILKCAMARLPNNPYLMTLHANLLVGMKHDGSAARSQLQLAAKATPSLLDRFFIYSSQQFLKTLKDENEGMDLIGYVEFQRSYRGCVKAHRLALQAQRQFWHSVLHDAVSFKDLQAAVAYIDKTSHQANTVYKRGLERYPTNGKLLRIYGRFLEYVRNDPWGASKFYSEALKQGTTESLMSLTAGSTDSSGMDAASRITAAMGPVDEKNDAIIIINASGIIMMVNWGGCKLLGYDKGELDGKNVSTLMPMPFSGRHNSWLQRCSTTGQSHILNSMRQVVALHKDRSVFPVSLAITRISGSGQDSMYMGILRKFQVKDDGNVTVFALPNGTVLCTDASFRDCFGLAAKDVMGRMISGLSTDQESFDRWIAACVELPREQVVDGAHKLRTKMLHKHLSPIDVEVTCEFGGSDEQKLLLISLHCFTDSLALMVVDPKGRIQFATTQMANMEPSAKPPPSSCRAGAVVHLLHAKGTRLPVTLQMSQHDDGERMQHAIKVIPATEAQSLDQQRLELQLNHKGVVLSVNEHASKAIFGFEPACLLGRPLAAFINLFDAWRQKFGEDESLLVMLGLRAEQNLDVVLNVGIHNPMTDSELVSQRAASNAGTTNEFARSTLLATLQQRRKERPAVLALQMVHLDDDMAARAAVSGDRADSIAVLTVQLWRADGLTGLVEVDGSLSVERADPAAALLFGKSSQSILHANFQRLVVNGGWQHAADVVAHVLAHSDAMALGLPVGTTSMQLLTSGGKKSMLKQGAAWKMGPVQVLDINHQDKTPLKVRMQAVSKDGKHGDKLIITLQVLESSLGSLESLLAMKASSNAGSTIDHEPLPYNSPIAVGKMDADEASESEPDLDAGNGNDEAEWHRGKRSESPEDLHARLSSRLRVAEWVDNSTEAKPPRAAQLRTRDALDDGNTLQLLQQRKRDKARSSSSGQANTQHGKKWQDDDAEEADHAFAEVKVPGRMGEGALRGKGAAVAAAGDGDDAASAASGSQSAGDVGEGQEAASSAAGSDAEDELVADWRRAKRLKKLIRMMTSSVARASADRFKIHTYLLVLVAMLAHVACFAVLFTQIDARYQTAFQVSDMAQAIEKSQMGAMRANQIQKCQSPEYSKTIPTWCSKKKGTNKLEMFQDKRLMDKWTYEPQPEVMWFKRTQSSTQVMTNGTNSLWEMVNRFIQSMQEIKFNAYIEGYNLDKTSYFNYVFHNGPDSIFTACSWSMDVIVDFAWNQLGSLSNVLVALLVVEVVVVMLSSMSYQFILLKAADLEAMRHFSVFLALPSATVRGMASRQMQVDDDDKSDVDDEEMEAIKAALTAETDQQQPSKDGGDKQSKSVRVLVAPERGSTKPSGTKKSALASKGKAKAGALARKPSQSAWRKFSKKFASLFIRTAFKVNGKKLFPYNMVLYKFMVPLLLWICAVIVCFCVSFQMLQGLQGPLASLNAASHVRYRLARCRLLASNYCFAETFAETDVWRVRFLNEVELMRSEYNALLYGGVIPQVAQGMRYDDRAPAAAFSNPAFSNIFFKTTECLRLDQSTCFQPGSPWYDITHSGLDAMATRYLNDMVVFANLPNEIAFANHSSYEFATLVVGFDMYDGLTTASGLFVDYTISRFEAVKQLHIIVLAITLLLGLIYVFKVFRPYVRRLQSESKIIAGMMSSLPAEVDVEAIVKTQVLGIRRDIGSMRMGSVDMGSNGMPNGAGVAAGGMAPPHNHGGLMASFRGMPLAGLLPPMGPPQPAGVVIGGGYQQMARMAGPGPVRGAQGRQNYGEADHHSREEEDGDDEEEVDD
eukprot:gene9112-9281_t